MKGHAIAFIVWLGLLAGGWYAFEHFGRSTPEVRGCGNGSAAREIVVEASRDGHFYLEGTINDLPVRFLVDTGASYVTVGLREAERARIPDGVPAVFDTANGRVEGRLAKRQGIRVACLEVDDVTVAVSPGLGEVALLGQNFLRRFEVIQSGRELRLRVKP
jgi:aspartyl protease family protein